MRPCPNSVRGREPRRPSAPGEMLSPPANRAAASPSSSRSPKNRHAVSRRCGLSARPPLGSNASRADLRRRRRCRSVHDASAHRSCTGGVPRCRSRTPAPQPDRACSGHPGRGTAHENLRCRILRWPNGAVAPAMMSRGRSVALWRRESRCGRRSLIPDRFPAIPNAVARLRVELRGEVRLIPDQPVANGRKAASHPGDEVPP